MRYYFQGHLSNFKVTQDKKIANIYPNWAFPSSDSSLNSPMDLKWCTKLDVVSKRCLILFFEVVHQISRSHGLINRRFESNLSKITGLVAAITSLWFALLCDEYLLITVFDSKYWWTMKWLPIFPNRTNRCNYYFSFPCGFYMSNLSFTVNFDKYLHSLEFVFVLMRWLLILPMFLRGNSLAPKQLCIAVNATLNNMGKFLIHNP